MQLKSVCAGVMLLIAAGMVQAAEITVSAASSLSNAMRDIARDFEQKHPQHKVLLNFAASGALLQQIAKGAPVDVFASADQDTMDQAQQQNLIRNDSRRDFAGNALVLVVPADSKLKLQSLADLQQAAVQKVAIGNPASVPVGRYAQDALQQARLWPAVSAKAILTQNVRQSLDYVARGEVEAGFVYATDAAIMADKVRQALRVPLAEAVRYPLAVTRDSKEPQVARQFADHLRSPAGQAVLLRYGFLKP